MSEKLQKILARGGFGSRREIEAWIEAGRVAVAGKIARLGDRVTGDEEIRIDGRKVSARRLKEQPTEVILYHKPVGEVVTRKDESERKTVFDALPDPKAGRWIAVGRLDINTSGLLILTTNGELANRLMHPSHELEREYAVRVLGAVAPEVLESFRQGVMLEDGPAQFERIEEAGGEGANHWYHVVIKEGRNREVRRIWEAGGVTVSRLVRIRYGHLSLPRNLKTGDSSLLERRQINRLLRTVGLPEESGDLEKDRRGPPSKGATRPRTRDAQRRGGSSGRARKRL